MSVSPARPARVSPTPERIGGVLCLDFANTVDAGRTASPREHLHDHADLVAWGQYAGLLSDEQATAAQQEIRRAPDRAAADFQQAIDLREAIFRTFAAVADGLPVPEPDLDLIRSRYLESLTAARLVRCDGHFNWSWQSADLGPLQRLLWPIARSAVDLLTASDLGRVKICASGTCRWLFLDHSKNATRRWCSMADCGSRAKMRRQYARRRATRPSAESPSVG
jgi:predicted RNA-binding Zn ribbon-like protein